MIIIWSIEAIKKAGGYRSLQGVSHGVEPNLVLPAIGMIAPFARFGKVIDVTDQQAVCSREVRYFGKIPWCDLSTTPLAPPIAMRAPPRTRPAPPIAKCNHYLNASDFDEFVLLQLSSILSGPSVVREMAIRSNKSGETVPLGFPKPFVFHSFLLLGCSRSSSGLVIKSASERQMEA